MTTVGRARLAGRCHDGAMRVSTGVAGAVLVVALTAGGCSSGGGDADDAAGSTTTAEASTTTVDPAAVDVAEQYLEALTAADGPDVDAMTALSAPDSVAENYAVHTAALAELQAAAGEPVGGGEVRVEGDTVIATLVGSGGATVDTTWADFTLDDNGLLVDFTINGVALDDRLVVDGASDTVDDVTIAVVSAFELVTNDSPVVILEIDNGGAGPYRLRGASYEAPDGTTVTSSPDEGRGLVVPAGGTNRALLIFAPAPFAGTLTLEGAIAGAPLTHELTLTP